MPHSPHPSPTLDDHICLTELCKDGNYGVYEKYLAQGVCSLTVLAPILSYTVSVDTEIMLWYSVAV